MDAKTVEILCELNNDFYDNHHESFAATRMAPWAGWRVCLDILKEDLGGRRGFSVFDLACGNLRFESFVKSLFPTKSIIYHAIDNCERLVEQLPQVVLPSAVNYQNLDVLDVLQKGLGLSKRFESPPCDLSVSFGFMHHVPLQEYRSKILSSLIDQTNPGGYVLVSFWQFLKNDALAKKAYREHNRACEELRLPPLEENDYVLGWKSTPYAYRYCHNFSEKEIDWLVEEVSDRAITISRFSADGRTGNLNTYLVVKRLS